MIYLLCSYMFMSNLSFTDGTERVNTSQVIGSNGSISLSWSASPTASCGYIVDWCRTLECSNVEWLKVAPGETSASIFSSKSYSLPTKQLQLSNVTFL